MTSVFRSRMLLSAMRLCLGETIAAFQRHRRPWQVAATAGRKRAYGEERVNDFSWKLAAGEP
jgi:hypothetical protein